MHNKELYNLCSEINVIKIIRLGRMGGRHAAQVTEMEIHTKF
jgi:hypothetical protein